MNGREEAGNKPPMRRGEATLEIQAERKKAENKKATKKERGLLLVAKYKCKNENHKNNENRTRTRTRTTKTQQQEQPFAKPLLHQPNNDCMKITFSKGNSNTIYINIMGWSMEKKKKKKN